MSNDKIRSVLVVCTGNSCRSVMAQALLKKYLKEAGKGHIEVLSAGVGAVNGFSPTGETAEVLKEEGIDISGFKSRRLTAELIKNSDLVLVMEETHRQEVIKMVPEADSKTYLMKKFSRKGEEYRPEGFSIPDPIGRPIKDYEFCLGMIKEEIKRIAGIL